MRSFIILEVEHDGTTDGVQMLAERCVRITDKPKWSDVDVTDYTVAIDIPPYLTATNINSILPKG